MLVNKANLAGIFTSFQTIFNQSLEITEATWQKLATLVPSATSKEDYKWLGSFPMLREWIGERYIKQLEAFKYEVENKNFESTVAVDRNDIEDDQYGVYGPMIAALAQNAKVHPDKLLFALMVAGFASQCYDGQYFFDTDHKVGGVSVSNTGGGAGAPWFLLDMTRPIKPFLVQMRRQPEFVAKDDPDDENVFMKREYIYGVDYRGNVGYTLWQLAYGSKDTLDETNYNAARVAMMSLKNNEGVPLGIEPKLLVVGPSNEAAARELLISERTAAGATNKWRGTAELMVSPWLS